MIEGTAKAAIQDQNPAPSATFIEPCHKPGRLNSGSRQSGLLGVSSSEIQVAAGIQQAVAREVNNYEFIGFAS